MQKPNFFIVGAARCGTTSLYHYLDQHDEIYMSKVKEPGYFCGTDDSDKRSNNSVKPSYVYNWESYLDLFEGANDNHKVLGEASADYLYCKEAPNRIKNRLDNPKFLAILRDPVDRAHSHYKLLKNKNATSFSSFKEAIQEDPQYLERGLYYEQISRYISNFPKNSVKVILFDDFVENTEKVVRDVFAFLKVDDEKRVKVDKKYNAHGKPKIEIITDLINENSNLIKTTAKTLLKEKWVSFIRSKIQLWNNIPMKKEEVGEDLERYIRDYFRTDLKKLDNILSIDIDEWY
ncbi:sulfotransferase family protein [Salinibacter ruber]|uniref:sulfotransferase family protein n=1 Tax=Salinibacter ruber TaxID=146919 RepID=UPI002167222C|nr:sulfotransferase [Salinibacter ruber]MCS4055897.1 hypothetical protein [Salinibacter ruber]